MHPAVLAIIQCPQCGGPLRVVDAGAETAGIEHGSVSCRDCQAAYQVRDQILDLRRAGTVDQAVEQKERDELARTYATANIDDIMKLVARNHYVPTMVHQARTFAGDYPEDSWLLDIGVGWGWHWVDVRSPHIVAMDLSIDSLLVARKLLRDQVDRNVHLVCANATDLPFREQAVDGIWSVQTLQHIPGGGLESCLLGCARMLKAGGGLQIYWLNWASGIRVLRRLLGKRFEKERAEPYYLRYLTGSELASLVAEFFTGPVATEYSEVLFHPELRLHHRLPLWRIDSLLGRVPLLNRAFARQVTATIPRRQGAK